MQQVIALLNDSGFLNALLALVAAVVFVPGGVAQQVLAGLGGSLERWAQKRLPANQYAQLKTLAEDAVRAAWQYGSSQGWDNSTKKATALAEMQAAAKAHGIDTKKWPTDVLGAMLESVWIDVKQTLPAALPPIPTPIPAADQTAPAAAPAVPAAAQATPPIPAASFIAQVPAARLGGTLD